MTEQQRKSLVDSLNALCNTIHEEPGFLDDQELKATFLVLHAAAAAVKFHEVEPLAELCADFCKEKAEAED